MTTEQTPAHLAPESCFVCGKSSENHTSIAHAFWSNADASKQFAQQPQGDTDVEARFVAQHRPY